MELHGYIARVWGATPPSVRKLVQRAFGGGALGELFMPSRMATVEVQSGLARGMRMTLNLRSERTLYTGVHESEVQDELAKLVTPGMVVYNVGAHVGFLTLILARLVGAQGKVVTFEPNPKVRVRTIEHIRMNGFDGRVKVEECALSDYDGNASFSLSLSDFQGRFDDLPFVTEGEKVNVVCKKFDTYLAEGGPIPQFVTMDVEHAEGRVLKGMAKFLEEHKPLLLIEMHGPEAIAEAWGELKRHGYWVKNVENHMKLVERVEEIQYGHYLAGR